MKYTKYLLMIVLSIMLVGCGKKEEVKEPTYVDGNIAVTDITGEIQGVESTEEVLISDEEWNILQEAPRTDIGTFDTSHFSKQQLEIYEKLLTNKYIEFTNDEAKDAAITFFSSDVQSIGYRESASIMFHTPFLESEDGKDFANMIYSADVQDRRENMMVKGNIQIFTKPSETYEVETYLSKTDGYYYVKLGEDVDIACSLTVNDSDLYDLFNDLAYIFTNVEEVVVLDTTADGYMCKFEIPADLITKSTLLNKQYVNNSFMDYGVDTVGYLYVNTETKQIQTVTFEQTIIDNEKYGTDINIEELKNSTEPIEMATYTVSYTFNEFNKEYDYVMEERQTAEILEAYYLYLVENKKEAELLLNGGTENDVQDYHKTEAEKEAERQLLEQMQLEEQQNQQGN